MAKRATPPAAAAPSVPAKRGRGRPAYVPNDEDTARVEALAAAGVVHGKIAGLLGIHEITLRKHYRKILDLGATAIDADSINAVVKAIRDPDKAYRKDALAASMWWQKSRMGWTDRTPAEQDNLGAVPVRLIIEKVGDAAPARVDAPASRPALPPRSVDLVGDK